MYSLYRAWFGDGVTGDNYTRLQETLSPPDTVVRVGNEGEHQFIAHKGVLAAHSGYLKALLTSASTSNSSANFGSCTGLPAAAIAVTTTNLTGQSTRQPVTSVSVSSIGGEAFAPLLNYMYTGRLEVTLDNVYSVLLATHLLHMPGALEQCRAALLRLRAPAPLPTPMPVPGTPTSTSTSMSTSASCSGNILRPIPNRLMVGPSMCWPPPAPLYPTAPAPASVGIPHLPQLQPSVLMQSAVPPPSVPVITTPTIHEAQNSTRYRCEVSSPKTSPSQTERNRGSRMDPRSRSPEIETTTSLPFAAAAFNAFASANATTSGTRVSSPAQSISPVPSSTSRSPLPLRRGMKVESTEQQRNKERDQQGTSGQSRRSCVTSVEETSRNGDGGTDNPLIGKSDFVRSSRRRGRGSSSGNDSTSSGVLSVVYDVACCDGPVKFHRVLNENYSTATPCVSAPVTQSRLQRQYVETESASSENDENGGPATVSEACDPIESGAESSTGGTGSYTCGYCRHTFKTQYCYRKHAKRHLLSHRVQDSSVSKQRQDAARSKREVRLLDLNVQYYPCKICGCKFPSYYFVHKHRKLCHANMEERSRSEGTNSGVQEQELTATAIRETP